MSEYKVEFQDEETHENHSMILDDESLSFHMENLFKMSRQITNIYELTKEESLKRKRDRRKAHRDWAATMSALFGEAGAMIQATILAFIPNIIQEHRYKQLPQCISCQRRFTENEFASLLRSGHNIVWNIDYAECPDCGGEIQGWRRAT